MTCLIANIMVFIAVELPEGANTVNAEWSWVGHFLTGFAGFGSKYSSNSTVVFTEAGFESLYTVLCRISMLLQREL